MRLPRGRVRSSTGHHELDRALLVIVALPLWTQSDDCIVEVDADSPAHADNHSLAVERSVAGLEVLHEVFSNQGNALFRTYERFDACPLSLETLLLVQRLILGQLRDLGVDL